MAADGDAVVTSAFYGIQHPAATTDQRVRVRYLCVKPVEDTFDQVADKRTADADAKHHEPADGPMIHQLNMIVGRGISRPIDFRRARRLTTIGVAQIGRDHAKLVFELVKQIEWMCREPGDR